MTTVQFIRRNLEQKTDQEFRNWFNENFEMLMHDEKRDMFVCYVEHANPDRQFLIVQNDFEQFYNEYFLD